MLAKGMHGISGIDEYRAMSSFWRKNTSSVEAVELANLLKALRKVVGHLGANTGSVEYAGVSNESASSIIVDPATVMGTYPVVPEKTDMLVGQVVHEAMLRIEWSEHVWKSLDPTFSTMGSLALIKFQKLIKAAEDIYADGILEGTVLGSYLRLVRKKELNSTLTHAQFTRAHPSFDALISLWVATTFGHKGTVLPDRRHHEPLKALIHLSGELAEIKEDTSFVINRCRARERLYRDTWAKIRDAVEDLSVIDKRICWIPEHLKAAQGKHEKRVSPGIRSKGLSRDLVNDIESQLAASSSNITPLIQRVAGHDNQDIVPTSRWDYNIPAHPVVDRVLAGRISAIFASYSDREKVVSRGLSSGTVDGKRLYRAAVTGKCFKYTDSRPAMDWNVTLLIDASGSMRGGKWRNVENTVSTLHHALKGYRNSLSAYAYFEIDGICMISSLIRKDKVLSVPPFGQTASGQAIIAAALFMPKKKRRRLLIHITDGESNFGLDVSYGITFCRENNIHLITLGCGCQDKKAMQDQYGNTIEFISGFRMLPSAIERLLRWTFLYGSRMPHQAIKKWGNACTRGGNDHKQPAPAGI